MSTGGKWNPDQFEVVGMHNSPRRGDRNYYARILIRRRGQFDKV